MKGFETPKHFITFPPLFITFSPFSAKSASPRGCASGVLRPAVPLRCVGWALRTCASRLLPSVSKHRQRPPPLGVALLPTFCRLWLCRSLNRPTKSPQRALILPLRHFSALGGLSLHLGRFRAVSALYRLRAVATLCASRVSPYSLALSSRVSAWVVNLPLNRLIASCFFASTIFA